MKLESMTIDTCPNPKFLSLLLSLSKFSRTYNPLREVPDFFQKRKE